MWRFNFFFSVSFPSQNLPQHSPFQLRTRTFHKPTAQGEAKNKPKAAPSRRLHLNEILEKGGKTIWRFYFFCSVSFPSQNLPQCGPFQLRTRTFRKPTAQGEAKNKPKAAPSRRLHLNEIVYKGGTTMWRFNFFCSVYFPSQNLPRRSPGRENHVAF